MTMDASSVTAVPLGRPVVLLISGIYELARQQGIELIDLGTSMLNGKINRSLLHFKRSIGGQSNRKLIFEKTL